GIEEGGDLGGDGHGVAIGGQKAAEVGHAGWGGKNARRTPRLVLPLGDLNLAVGGGYQDSTARGRFLCPNSSCPGQKNSEDCQNAHRRCLLEVGLCAIGLGKVLTKFLRFSYGVCLAL